MSDRFFTVKSDRFSLIKENEYIIHGWLAHGAHLTAEADGKPAESESEAVYHFNDERYGGIEVRCGIALPEGGVRKSLCLYAERDGEKQPVFTVSAAGIREKQRSLQTFLDETVIHRGRNAVYITGWAAAASPVTVSVREAEIAAGAQIDRVARPDVTDMYEECRVEEESGFNIRISPIPPHGLTLVFEAGNSLVTEHISTGPLSSAMAKGGRLIKKGIRHLRYNGIASFSAKVKEKLTGPKVKPVFYPDWIKAHLPDEKELARQRAAELPGNIAFSVIPLEREEGIPESRRTRFEKALEKQTYKAWDKTVPEDSGALQEDKWYIPAAGDGMLTPNALFEIASYIAEHPETEMVYSDSDAVDENGAFSEPDMKPDFAPDYLAARNYIGVFAAVRGSALKKAGPEYFPKKEEDLYRCWLRMGEICTEIGHIPKVLFHENLAFTVKERGSDPAREEREMREVQAHYDRMQLPAKVTEGIVPFTYRTVWQWEEKPLVSVLIPNKDHIDDLRICIQSLTEKCSYPNIEIIIIENNSVDPSTFEGYEALQMLDSRIRTVTYEGGFNYSKINNFGAAHANGDYFFLLNNDTEALSDVITELLGYCMRPDVGIAGTRLYYGDNTIQHAGVVLGWGGVAGHAFVNQKRGAERYLTRIACQQNYSAVTAAAMMVDRKAYEEVGGLSEDLAVAFNDIDFCMKVRKAGYLVVYNPFAEMYHYESKSRGLEDSPEKKARFQREIANFQGKWGDVLAKGDPFYNQNLSMITQDFSLKEL